MPIPADFNRATRNIRNRASRMTRKQKLSAAGVAVVGASVLAVSVVPGAVQASGPSTSPAVAGATKTLQPSGSSQAARTELAQKLLDANKPASAQVHTQAEAAKAHQADVAKKADAAKKAEAAKKADAAAKAAVQQAVTAKTPVPKKDDVKKPVQHPAQAQAHAKAKAQDKAKAKANAQAKVRTVAKSAPEYPDNLNGWIHEALAIMKKHHIPGSYDGIHRNIIRESSGNPKAINLWDINAKNGIPSKGLLQVIPPTFAHYHVAGTSNNIYDPVANIVAACNYAAHRYGSMDNVNSAY